MGCEKCPFVQFGALTEDGRVIEFQVEPPDPNATPDIDEIQKRPRTCFAKTIIGQSGRWKDDSTVSGGGFCPKEETRMSYFSPAKSKLSKSKTS